MKRRGVVLMIAFALPAAAAAAGAMAVADRTGVAALAGLATLLAEVSLYSMPAAAFGWPTARWQDVAAWFYLVP